MASENVYSWIEANNKYVKGNVLEIGSRRYSDHSFLDLRTLAASQPKLKSFLGTDLIDGDNVDVVTDLTLPFSRLGKSFKAQMFNTVFCISVLEHIPDVFTACKNISQLIKPGGALFLSVPFVFRFHGYPSDYWRFTPEAIKILFPDIDFRDGRYSQVSSLEPGDTMSLSKDRFEKLNRFLYRPKSRDNRIGRKQAKLEDDFSNIEPYSLAPSMINMLGFRKEPSDNDTSQNIEPDGLES